MRVLVTGGAGFIGSHLVDALIGKGHSVRVLDNFDPQVHASARPDYLNSSAEYIEGDVRDREALRVSLAGIDSVVHLAAAVGVGQSMYQIEHYVAANCIGTSVLLEFLVSEKIRLKRLVVASSMSIYGEGDYRCGRCGPVAPTLRPDDQLSRHEWEMLCPACGAIVSPLPTPETKPLIPTSVYAITKRDQEELCLTVGRSYGIPTVALRFFSVYGPRQALSNPYTGVCAIFSSRIKNGNPPLIYEDGLQNRDFISVRDIVKALALVLEHPSSPGEVFNVGTGRPTSVLDVATALIRLYGCGVAPEVTRRFRAGDIRHCYADIRRIERLGFRPSVSLDDGMRELVAWGETVKAVDRVEEAAKELVDRGLTV